MSLKDLKNQERELMPQNRGVINTLDDNKVNVFVMVCHGESTAVDQRYYPVENKFKAISMFHKPLEVLTDDELNKVISDPCRFLLGNCPIINHRISDKISQAWLAPLIFSMEGPNETSSVNKYLGLYHLIIELNDLGTKSCTMLKNNKILSNEEAINYNNGFPFGQIKNGVTEPFTYSDIFSVTYKYCKEQNIDPRKSVMGIFSCGDTTEYQKGQNYRLTELLLPKASVQIPKANILNSALGKNWGLLALTKYNFENWNPLAKQKSKGCGLNVLSYYNIIDTNDARNQTVCLPTTGTSIFKIIDIYDYYMKSVTNIPQKYIVTRRTLKDGISDIINFLRVLENDNNINENYGLLFKMYESYYQPKTINYNHVGHTISIGIQHENINQGIMYLLDPQSGNIKVGNEEFLKLTTLDQLKSGNNINLINETIINKIISIYGNNYGFMDNVYYEIIDYGYNTIPNEISNDSRYKIPSVSGSEINQTVIPREGNLRYGGKSLKKHKQTKKESKYGKQISRKNKLR